MISCSFRCVSVIQIILQSTDSSIFLLSSLLLSVHPAQFNCPILIISCRASTYVWVPPVAPAWLSGEDALPLDRRCGRMGVGLPNVGCWSCLPTCGCPPWGLLGSISVFFIILPFAVNLYWSPLCISRFLATLFEYKKAPCNDADNV